MLFRIDCLRDVMDMDKRDLALELLPCAWRDAAQKTGWAEAEEVRLRLGRAPALLLAGSERVFRQELVTEEQLRRILEKATGASMHAAVQGLSEGYVSYRGLRIGVCGTAVTREGKVSEFSGGPDPKRMPRHLRRGRRSAAALGLSEHPGVGTSRSGKDDRAAGTDPPFVRQRTAPRRGGREK